MFLVMLIVLSIGYPVAFSFGAVSMIFGGIAVYAELASEGITFADFSEEFMILFSQMPLRIYSVMNSKVLMAIPLFIFMGIVLQKSELAERLLQAVGVLFGNIRGGLGVGVIFVGTLLASSTGVVGASVVAMGVISLPVMIKYGYDKPFACGSICASGTLGQIIPPSIVLIILADVFGQPVGDLFKAAIGPSLALVACYMIYILVAAYVKPELGPIVPNADTGADKIIKALKAIIPPLILIIGVLGSIFAGIATPTESAAVGAIGSLLLAFMYRKLSIETIISASKETVKITSMVFAILIGATAFSLVFVYTGGDALVEEFMTSLPGEKWGFVILSMLIILFLGFFIDFIEISYIVVPILLPISEALGIDPIWFAVLIAMNLQTSFLTPPFGFSLFYLKGVAKHIKTTDIYKGVMPFILIQVIILASIVAFPSFYGFNQF